MLERIHHSRLMNHLLRMKPTFYERNRTGDLMARATNDLRAVSTTAGFGILTFVDSSAFILTILFMMGFFTSWKLTLTALLPLPIIALMVKILGAKIHERFTRAQNAFGRMNDEVLETISGIRVIRAFVQEKASEDKFKNLTNDVYIKNVEVARIDALFEPTVKVLVGISYLIGLCYGSYLVFRSELTLGIVGRERLGNINGMIAEGIQGMPIIQVFRRQSETIHEFEEQNEQYLSFQNKMQKLNSLTSHNLVNVRCSVFCCT